MRIWLAVVLAIYLTTASPVTAETVDVKYQGLVPLETFECHSLKPSSLVNRICYDADKSYLIVQLRSTYYHYCGVGSNLVSEWINASSLGKFYNKNIKVSSNEGLYDCRNGGVPNY